jgi:hypothetical protein
MFSDRGLEAWVYRFQCNCSVLASACIEVKGTFLLPTAQLSARLFHFKGDAASGHRDESCDFFPVCPWILLSVVLYGCETWSLRLREEHRVRVFENRVLRRIFGPKGDEVIGGWRKLHNEELHDLYSSSINIMIKSRRMRWAGHVA